MTTQHPSSILDRQLIAINDGFEVNYLQQRLGVSRSDVLDAISAVGNGRREVIAWLEKRKRKGTLGTSPTGGGR